MKTMRPRLLVTAVGALLSLVTGSAAAADISITNTTQPNPAIVRRNLTYGMNVINNGPDPATNVVVTDILPPGVILASAVFRFQDRPPTPCTGTLTITCNIGTLGVGRLEGAGVFIMVQPRTTEHLSNTATVTADGADPNSATVETDVEPQVPVPVTIDPNLAVSPVVSGLSEPTGLAFLGTDDFLVLEKGTGRVKRVVNGTVQSTPVLELPVNSFSERGLLAIALHPDFAKNHFVYIRWTCRGSVDGDCEPGPPTDAAAAVPLLGNRVDRFIWDGSTLTFDTNLIQLRAYQADAGQPLRGNHNGGKIHFGPDKKLYIYMGDNGRRGWMQNVTEGQGPAGLDDQFGGPEPDNAHLTGVILRLNDDGGTPEDNPFVDVITGAGPEVDANIHKVFAYGIRNGFGFAFDPVTGQLWESQNGDDSMTEINRIEGGSNGGWVQIMGRVDHIADFKAIETSPQYFGLQQIRWPPTLIADTADEALERLFMLPGAHYLDPLLTWKFEIAPAGFGFVQGQGLGAEYAGDIVVGGARDFLFDGHLFRLKLAPGRMDLDLSGVGGRVIEAADKWDITGSESLLFGKGFGLTSDIVTGPNGNLFVVSLSKGAVYQIQRQAARPTR
jgi:glucose/arabinose dehydrogenase